MSRSYVVTGAGKGIGRAIAERLLAGGGVVVVLDRDDAALAAIEGLTRALAVDYGPHGIRANAVALGSIATERYHAYLASQDPATVARAEEQLRALHPLRRVGQPAEAAAAVAYLLSEDASFINGAVLPVDGGRSALGLDPEGT